MKVLFLSTYDLLGGACRGTYKLLTALRRIGVDAVEYVQEKSGDNPAVTTTSSPLLRHAAPLRRYFDLLPLNLIHSRRDRIPFSPHWVPDRLAGAVRAIDPDLIHLHWVSAGFLRIETLAKFRKPIVWTFRDMWAMTGGCHYNGDCRRFENGCGDCPILHSGRGHDMSRWILNRKKKAWADVTVHVAAPSRWIGDEARRSALFRDADVTNIPNGVDLNHFRPMDKDTARSVLGLPRDKTLLLFGAAHALADRRKGVHLLQEALRSIAASPACKDVELVVFGSSEPAQPVDFGFRTHYLGRLEDNLTLCLAYNAADVFIAPSLQENMANTVLESLACGVPVAAFDVGGMGDMVRTGRNGLLVPEPTAEGLAEAILSLLAGGGLAELGRNGRADAEDRFDILKVARQYLELYEEVAK
jgi:glycosyltransferase involved in cell wall biosynthesis